VEALIVAARHAADKAYAPYSRFSVGAAVLAPSGRVYAGCNAENASYGLSICAQRNAAFQAIAAGERAIVAVVVYTPTAVPTAPCRACRQVIGEFGLNARVLCVCDGPECIETTLDALLPASFGPHSLRPAS
jgi:cytidine deaminase